MIHLNLYEAKTQLSGIIENIHQGEGAIIAKADRPIIPLTSISPPEKQGRRFGVLRGKAIVDERFFEPLPDNELDTWE
uniref:Antitoxin component of toxin-antitoxin stability system, DNA-binding transcriptional repressor n=1 Tax=Candidatus Kentrum sp. UNK TaxID=2126344 RepID=A0A451AMI2_9GAMM|nr:MAG: Antitoxin component of toxin-antitoxin stability system, DNA-binding transcriptional repressor [Candidatus Kentron sp. UNK]VFK72577.1 MAG: Antitoxin component of toxin-antitoxin stability system, DNA-binding transcriptional repressor [Candidatus Kentron sp. UNK]